MIYLYDNRIGFESFKTRQEAVYRMKAITNENKYEIEPYWEYKKTYEAIILYIISRANEVYPDYTTRKRVGQIFTIAMLRWYKETDKTYTGEKPIKCGKVARYGGQIGFSAFDKYYDNIRGDTHIRKNDEGWYVVFTEIPQQILKKLVDSEKMIHIIHRSVEDANFKKAERTIHNMYYKHTDDRFKRD